VTEDHVPDEIHDQARSQFSEQELVDLTIAVVAINGWNRLNIAFRTVPGGYRPQHAGKTSAAPLEPAHA
jgi:alkylhydroperoxidase family enzyme